MLTIKREKTYSTLSTATKHTTLDKVNRSWNIFKECDQARGHRMIFLLACKKITSGHTQQRTFRSLSTLESQKRIESSQQCMIYRGYSPLPTKQVGLRFSSNSSCAASLSKSLEKGRIHFLLICKPYYFVLHCGGRR